MPNPQSPVSVVIPFSPEHTSDQMLEEAKQSVNQQSVPTEIIVVEDTEQRGPAWARNKGLDQAEGRYVAFLDADDIWLPDKLERQLTRMEQTGAGLCVDGPPMSTERFIFEVLIGRSMNALTTSILIDTAQVTARFSEDLTRWEDGLFILECASQGGVCCCEKTFVERRHEGSLSVSYDMDTEHSLQQGHRFASLVRERVPEARRFIGTWYLILYLELVFMQLHSAAADLRSAAKYSGLGLRSLASSEILRSLLWSVYYVLRRPLSLHAALWKEGTTVMNHASDEEVTAHDEVQT